MNRITIENEHDMASAISKWYQALYNFVDQNAVTANSIQEAEAFQKVLKYLEENFPINAHYTVDIPTE